MAITTTAESHFCRRIDLSTTFPPTFLLLFPNHPDRKQAKQQELLSSQSTQINNSYQQTHPDNPPFQQKQCVKPPPPAADTAIGDLARLLRLAVSMAVSVGMLLRTWGAHTRTVARLKYHLSGEWDASGDIGDEEWRVEERLCMKREWIGKFVEFGGYLRSRGALVWQYRELVIETVREKNWKQERISSISFMWSEWPNGIKLDCAV